MTYIATIFRYAGDDKLNVIVDPSESASLDTREALLNPSNYVSKKVSNIYRKVVDTDIFIAYSDGAELNVEIQYDFFGQPTNITVAVDDA